MLRDPERFLHQAFGVWHSGIDAGSVKAYDAICRYTRGADDFLCRALRYPLGQSFLWVLELPR